MVKTKLYSIRKKLTLSVAAAVMLCGFGAMSASAATVDVGDFTIERAYSSKNVVTVKAYNGTETDIVLPEKATINGTEYTVEQIGDAFKDNKRITSVTIPEGYSTISASAFSGCTALTSVSIPGSLTSISANAFENCAALSNVTFAADTAAGLNIFNGAFSNCTSLTALELPARLNSSMYSFVQGCTALKSLTVAEGSTSSAAVDNVLYNISGDSATLLAYAHGKENTEFTIPDEVAGKAVKSIAMHAFRENGTLEKIIVPASVTDVKGYAFYNMSAIREIDFLTETVPTLSSYVCAEMAAGSKIIVQNADVAAAFEPQGYYTYYTPDNTTVEIAGTAAGKVSAVLSVDADSVMANNEITYHVYLDKSENVNTVLLKLSFDASQVDEGTLSVVKKEFSSSSYNWSTENNKLTLTAYLGITGNVTGYTSDEKTKLLSIVMPVKDNTKGTVKAELIKAACAGIPGTEESAMNGETTIAASTADYFIASYDVNNDSIVDIIDITEAQRYYQAVSADENWETAKSSDVNNDSKVDIEDYIAIFNHLSDF